MRLHPSSLTSGLNGLFAYWQFKSTADPNDPRAKQTLRILKDWLAARSLEPATIKNINSMSVLYVVACLVEADRQTPLFSEEERWRYAGWLTEWAEWAMSDLPRTKLGGFQHSRSAQGLALRPVTHQDANEQHLWDDTLMMTVLPLAKIGVLLGNRAYVEEGRLDLGDAEVAKYQFLLHIQYLADPSSGLWYHAWTFAEGGHNFARALWGRGNCWVSVRFPG